MDRSEPNILIVGAGPTGLTAAVELARYGIAARIIDKDDAPTPLSKAVGISPRSLDLLEASGVTERLLDRGVRIRHAHLWYRGKRLGRVDFSVLRHRFDFLLSLPQSETETVMCDVLAAEGIDVERRTTLTALKPDGEEIEVMTRHGYARDTHRVDCVFGADGAHSAVREAMGLKFEGYVHQRIWSIADAEMPDWPYEPGAAHLFLHDKGEIGFIIPIAEGRFRAVSNTEDALARIPSGDRASKVLRTDTFHIPVKQAETYQKDNVFLGGDAAHVHSPVGARGMNLGIEDAVSFVRRFVCDDLAGYTRERHPVGKRWIDLSERALEGAQAEGFFPVVLRNLVFRLIGHVPMLQRPLLERMAGLRE